MNGRKIWIIVKAPDGSFEATTAVLLEHGFLASRVLYFHNKEWIEGTFFNSLISHNAD